MPSVVRMQIFEACGLSSLLLNVLVGGLANSIYASYDPTQPFRSHQQYADIAHFGSDDSRMGPTTSVRMPELTCCCHESPELTVHPPV